MVEPVLIKTKSKRMKISLLTYQQLYTFDLVQEIRLKIEYAAKGGGTKM